MQVTPQLERVLDVFFDAPAQPHYGYALMKASGLKSGSLYPILARLEREGWIQGGWETESPTGRPRRYYRLTAGGAAVTRDELAYQRPKRALPRLVARPSPGPS